MAKEGTTTDKKDKGMVLRHTWSMCKFSLQTVYIIKQTEKSSVSDFVLMCQQLLATNVKRDAKSQ